MTERISSPIPRERLTAKLPVELIERVRNAVYWTPGLTLAGLTAEALAKYLDEIEGESSAVLQRDLGVESQLHRLEVRAMMNERDRCDRIIRPKPLPVNRAWFSSRSARSAPPWLCVAIAPIATEYFS